MPKVKASIKRLQNLRKSSVKASSENKETVVVAKSMEVDVPAPSVFDKLKWNKAAEEKVNRYRHGIAVTKRHEQRQRAQNRGCAKGSDKMTTFFTTSTIVKEQSKVEVEKQFSSDTLQSALEKVTSLLNPAISQNPSHQKAGPYEIIRLLAVKMYLNLRVNNGMMIMEASNETSKFFWPNSPLNYRSRKIRQDVHEFIEKGSLAPSMQGKHSKRFSLLDDSKDNKKFRFSKFVEDLKEDITAHNLEIDVAGDNDWKALKEA